jgi:hypothetical protein
MRAAEVKILLCVVLCVVIGLGVVWLATSQVPW